MSTSTPSATPAGWYGDPSSPGMVRYYDGRAWTPHVAPAAQPPAPRPGAEPTDAVHWLLPTGRTWQSIAAGYVALVAVVVWVLGPIALGLGVWALTASRNGEGHGRGRAVFAIVVGGLATIGVLAVLVSWVS
jgi:hypothetical protein